MHLVYLASSRQLSIFDHLDLMLMVKQTRLLLGLLSRHLNVVCGYDDLFAIIIVTTNNYWSRLIKPMDCFSYLSRDTGLLPERIIQTSVPQQ